MIHCVYRLEIAEEKRRKDEVRRAELKKIEEEKRRLEEETRRKEVELRRKQEEEERRMRAEEAAEEHHKLLQKKAEEDAAKIRKMHAAAEKARREENDAKVAKDVEKMLNSEDAWSSSKPSTPATDLDTPWQTATSKKSPPQKPKVAPWSTSSQSAPREKTLREIQEEEERQQAAEAREMARIRNEQEISGAPSIQAGTWANASQRISWNSSNVGKAPAKSAWGGAGIDAKPVVSSSNWDGPSLQAANKIVQSAAPTKKPAPQPAKSAPPKAAAKAPAKVPSVDPFTQWVTKKLKEINSEVDAEVLSTFLESVENPNEVEDYIEGSLGSFKNVKEFVKEHLQKRSEFRNVTTRADMSSASAAAPAPDKFQPAWIRSAFHGPGNGGSLGNSPRVSTNEEEPFIEPCPAVLAKNRYGREELLVLQPRPHCTLTGLERCPIYAQEYRAPVVTTAMTEHEQPLQMNINSSKAMSSLNQSDRMAVATGGSPNGPNSPQVKGNQWTPVKGPSNWSRGASQMGAGPGLNGRANLSRSLGRGNPLGQSEEQQSMYGQKYVPRGRGGAIAGRGASTTAGAAQINPRAQGLYDPRDPKDRPRNRLRSTSEDTEIADPDNGGWSQVRSFGRQNSSNAWGTREEGSWPVERENSFTAIQKNENGAGMPEWFDDGDEVEKPNENAGGSFDDDGRYRQPKENHAPSAHWKAQQQNSSAGQPDRPSNASQQMPISSGFNPSTSVDSVPAPNRVIEFYYLDPTETERGPFNKEQMYTWYQMNYFKDDLKVRRKEDTQYKTLGELKVLNGLQTVFDYKPTPPPAPPVPNPAMPPQPFGFPPNPGYNKNFFGAPGVWNEAMFAGPVFNSNVGAAFDEKDMLAEKQRYDSMQKMSPEYQQMMLLRAKQVEEQQRAVQEKELEYKRKQEMMQKQYEEELLKKQMEQLELQKKLEAIEAANQACIEEERRRHEAELKVVEEKRRKDEEVRRAELKKIEEEKRRLEEEVRSKEAELRRKQKRVKRTAQLFC